ncbi:AMP-binding protein [uncultured Roseibium sp.]|uniref:class I adenylate-forming enzyme family protein n=1 Tax=uncultured Roseibium sp. TaxID=1936171 RepID=UPI00261772B0|nr:AMP-binding protein [uncultured Roseibium sp.]
MNLTRYCLTNAEPAPDKTALEIVDDGGTLIEAWTYGKLTSSVLSVAAGLKDTGLKPGDRILLRIGHSVDFPLIFFGAIAGGFVPVPTSAQLTARETSSILSDSGARLLVHDGETEIPDNAAVLSLGPQGIYLLRQYAPGTFADTAADDPAFLVYTSGTSGMPKGVLHAQRAAFARWPMYRGWYGISSSDRLLHAGAFNWTYTLGAGLMDPWANGATSIVYDGPRDPDIWPGVIEGSDASMFAAVPSLFRRILKYGNITRGSFPNLRHGLTAGEALPASLYEDWKARTGRELYEALGMSEISTYLSSGPTVPVRPGSPGKPQQGRKVSILSETSNSSDFAETNEPGSLAIHSSEPGLMLGYWNAPEETEAAFRGEWFLTGDRARSDEDGYFWYEGRADDLMNAFGYRVAPEEVECVLAADPQVSEVAVTAVPVRDGVSLITAFVVPRDADTFDMDRLALRAEQNLADYKRPKSYRLVDQLPRTASGKVRRQALYSMKPSTS